jgi:hypothetical protein
MAQIEIEKKSGGTNWLWWIIGLIIAALLLWWLISAFSSHDANAAAVTDTTAAMTAPVATTPVATTTNLPPAAGTPITDMAMLTTVNDTTGLVGRPVQLTNVPVSNVVSDRGFWVGSSGSRVLAVRMDQLSPMTPPNGAVNAGERVDVFGTLRSVPTDLTAQALPWHPKTSADSAALTGQRVYIAADSVRILSH